MGVHKEERRRVRWRFRRMIPLVLLTLFIGLPAVFAADVHAALSTQSATKCNECHGSDIAARHHATPWFTQGECTQCHVGVTATGDCSQCHDFGIQNSHHTTGPAVVGNCAACHTNVDDHSNCLSCHQGQTRTRHHQIAASGVSCNSCHGSSMPSISNCRSCHTTPARERHHDAAATQNMSCSSCHVGIVETAGGCKSCHTFPTYNDNIHHSTNNYNLSCNSCHTMGMVGGFFQPLMPTTSDCINCHTTLLGSASIGEVHHTMTIPGQMQNCAACHQGVTAVSDCTACHTAGAQNVARHHTTELFAQGACIQCHEGAEAAKISCSACHANPGHHTQPQAISGNCNYCHKTIQVSGTGCKSCHTASSIPEVHHGEPLENLGGNCGACHQSVSNPTSCANCHSSSPHHNTIQSQSGDCAYCHKVPAFASDRPKQAACRECHGSFMHDKGGPIQNFGACAACHNTVPFHAAPKSIPGYTGYGAGKKKFNMFWSKYAVKEGPGERLRPNGEDMNDEGGRKIKAQQLNFNRVQIANNGKLYTVPSFDGVPYAGLNVCTSCHSDRKSMVRCDNIKWRDHLTKNRVDLATYQLAEATYIGNLCSGTGGGGTTPGACNVAPTGTYIEAEKFTSPGSGFAVRTGSGNGNSYLEATTNSTSSPSGTPVSYVLNFTQTGTYYIWFRGNDQRNSSYNSLWYGLNGKMVGDARTPASDSNWRWVNARDSQGPSTVAITISTPGTHTLNIWAKERYFRLDGIYLTRTSGTLPGGTSIGVPTGATVISPDSCSGSTGGSVQEPTPTTPANLALSRPATATRQESGYEASKAVDGNTSSRWWAKSTSTHRLQVDLGSSQSISKVVVRWHSYYAVDYRVQTSTDGSNWTSVASISSSSGGVRTHTFSSRNARYVRIECTKASSSNGYAVNELEVYQQ